jgi:hypothetical protein
MKNYKILKALLLLFSFFFLYRTNAQQDCRPDSIFSYQYNDAAKTKSISAKTYITYDADGNTTKLIKYFSGDNGKSWVPNLQQRYTYTNGQLSFLQIFIYDQTNKNWWEYRRLYYLYNNQGKVTDFYSTKYEAGSWLNDFYYKTAYDVQGRKLTSINSSWDPEGNRWEPYSRDSSLYDNNNREKEVITAFFINGLWQDGSKQTFFYNTEGQYSETYYFILSMGNWSLNRKWSYTYNNSGLLTEKITSAQRPDQTFYDFERTTNQYTSSGCLDNSHYYFLDVPSNKWITHTQEQYVFPVYDPQTNPLTVYPNPSGTLTLHFLAAIKTDFTLIDTNGKNVMEGTALQGDNEVGVQHLSAGLYVLRSGAYSQMVLLR